MSYSYTSTESSTFTKTHAIYIAMKMATDLKRIQRLYGEPSDHEIEDYSAEIIMLLKYGFLKCIIYGFKRNGRWIEPMLRYTAQNLSYGSANDDNPGRIVPGRDVSGAAFTSFLQYNSCWDNLSSEQRRVFKGQLPFQRSSGLEPPINGYLVSDLTYSAGGRAISRESLRSF